MFLIELLLWATIGFLLFFLLTNLLFAIIIGCALALFIVVRYKITTRHFIGEYVLDQDKLRLKYTENGTIKELELPKGKYKVEKDFTILYGRPGTKMTISWKGGSINQYWIGNWNSYKMKELIEANR